MALSRPGRVDWASCLVALALPPADWFTKGNQEARNTFRPCLASEDATLDPPWLSGPRRSALGCHLPWIPNAIIILLAFALYLLGLYLGRKRVPKPPRQVRREARWMLVVFLPLLALALWSQFNRSMHPPGLASVAMAALYAIVIVIFLYQWLHPATHHEWIANYAADPVHCGRCDYALTGNASGICPECGWPIPNYPFDIDTPGWGLWWRKWEIDHLRCWPATLALLLFNFFLLAAGSVLMAISLKNPPVVILMALMALQIPLNILSVARYGLKEARQSNRAKAAGASREST